VKLSYITDRKRRSHARVDRRKTLFSKAHELVTLCGGNIIIIVDLNCIAFKPTDDMSHPAVALDLSVGEVHGITGEVTQRLMDLTEATVSTEAVVEVTDDTGKVTSEVVDIIVATGEVAVHSMDTESAYACSSAISGSPANSRFVTVPHAQGVSSTPASSWTTVVSSTPVIPCAPMIPGTSAMKPKGKKQLAAQLLHNIKEKRLLMKEATARRPQEEEKATELVVEPKKRRTSQQQSACRPPSDADQPVYCLCKAVSSDKLIVCAYDKCEIKSFHFKCVGVKKDGKNRKQKWFCPNCRGSTTTALRANLKTSLDGKVAKT
jgi:hypothetical protein